VAKVCPALHRRRLMLASSGWMASQCHLEACVSRQCERGLAGRKNSEFCGAWAGSV
jgi:hypothetical protein